MAKINAKKDYMRFELVKERQKAIKIAITKPTLARIFYLILDDCNIGKELAQKYYDCKNQKNSRMKMNSNPKVISIYLKELEFIFILEFF
jgi:hypothetical protein